MAQASSVPAREPSMEEILASIRRIIEDSDGGHAPATPAAEARAPEPVEQPADTAAIEETADTASEEVDAFRSELSSLEQETEQYEPAVAETVYEEEPAPAPEAVAAAAPEPVEAPPARVPEAETRYEAPRAQQAVHQAPARGSIISEATSRQVTAAFEELSDAFASSQRRSFDEIAEELMRPMLQDWLDNNLPVLVERLVREEIERVARGGGSR